MSSPRLLALAALLLPFVAAAAEPAKPAPAVKAPAAKAPTPPVKQAPAALRGPPPKPPEPEIPEVPPGTLPTEAAMQAAPPGSDLTVYLNDVAMVREHRSLRLPGNFSRLTLGGVPAGLEPETALLEVVKGPPLKVVEQNFDFEPLTPQKLLEKAVGREVTVITTNPATGAEASTRATVLSATGGLVLQMGGRIYANPPGRIVYDSLPPGLHAAPALVMNIAGTAGQDLETEFSYLTGGLGWHANYVLNYDADAGRVDVAAWASITNTTGVEFKDARIKLVAGEVNRLARPRPMREMAMQAKAAPAAMAPGITEDAVNGNHIYTMPRASSLAPGETKQLALLSARGVAVKHDTVVHGQTDYFTQSMRDHPVNGPAANEMSFRNDASAKLGVALPSGTLRVYGLDEQGASQFLGESHLENVAEGGLVTVDTGRDYDVTAERLQTNFVHVSDLANVSAWRITIRNAKAKPVPVKIVEPVPGNWEITKENESHTKNDAGSAEWNLLVPAKGEAVLEYAVKSQL